MLLVLLWPAVCLFNLTAACLDPGSVPLVSTKEGLVRGAVSASAADRPFCSFKGIPYARPPVGVLRFRPPQRHPGWDGEHDGEAHGRVCPQIDSFGGSKLTGAEDCLLANVYTPRISLNQTDQTGLPVMVYIHGGGFRMGSGDDTFLGPKYFMDEDVVLVTFNYRLSAFGFLTTEDHHAPGNSALRDQVLLLQWVQDNIASFGGDPQSVTIFGESAGGSSVSILVLSPLSRGLFDRAISQSGSALATWALGGGQVMSAFSLARKLNCSVDDVEVMVECLQRQPYEDIVENTRGHEAAFQPRVDKEAEYPVIPDDPYVLLNSGSFNRVPWMNGITAEEGSVVLPFFSKNTTLMSELYSGNVTYWQDVAGMMMKGDKNTFDCDANATEEIVKVRDFYVGNLSDTNLLPLAQLVSDRRFVSQMSSEVRLASRHTSVYKYILDHTGPGRLKITDLFTFGTPGPDFGPTHGDDLMYLFSNDKIPLAEVGSEAYTMIRFMTNLWTNFARTGRPSSDILPTPDWPIFTERSQLHMRLNSQPSLGERLFEGRVNFWKTVRINEPWRHPVELSCAVATPLPYGQ